MALVNSRGLLRDARANGYAVGAFNVENMEMAKAVIAAAEEMRSPVMLQTTPSTVKYGSLETFAAIVKAEASKTDIPVCLHLDHGNSFELAVQAMKAGYTSVMIDGSHETFEENVALTKKVVEVANAYGVPVEAELGKVGGKEDDLEAEADHNTDPEEAKEFVENQPGEYDGMVAQGGRNFSGGQKQRLSIARAIAKQPEILVFDDSFSALDYKTDRVLRETIKKEIADTTNIIVAQRIGTIKDADRILVIEDGAIVGNGTHSELMKNCPLYQEIAYSQLSKEELEKEEV